MKHCLTHPLLLLALTISMNSFACKTAPAIVLIQKAQKKIKVEAEVVEFSTLPGTKWSTEMDLTLVQQTRYPETSFPPPEGLDIFTIKRGSSLVNGGKGELIATLPNNKKVSVQLTLKAPTRSRGGCGSSLVEYD